MPSAEPAEMPLPDHGNLGYQAGLGSLPDVPVPEVVQETKTGDCANAEQSGPRTMHHHESNNMPDTKSGSVHDASPIEVISTGAYAQHAMVARVNQFHAPQVHSGPGCLDPTSNARLPRGHSCWS